MTSDVESEDDDEERWAQAESILAGMPSEEAQRNTRRRRNQLLLFIGGCGLLGAVVGLLVGILFPSHHHHSSHPSGWSSVVGLALLGSGLLIDIAALVQLFRRGRWLQAWRGPLMVLTRRQRRSLLRQIAGRRPVEPERLPLARYTAEQRLELSRLQFPLFVGIALITAGNWLTIRDAFQGWLAVYWAVLLVLMLGLGGRQVRKARRFLGEHPAPED